MTLMKTALIAGALTIASTAAFAQIGAPTAGVNYRTLNYQAYQAQTNGADSFASADRVRTPRSNAASRWRIDPRSEGAGYVTGGGVDLR